MWSALARTARNTAPMMTAALLLSIACGAFAFSVTATPPPTESGSTAAPVTLGIITTIAGTGDWGYSGDGGAASSSRLWDPLGVAVDPSGNLFIADFNNVRVRRVSATTGTITTVAGSGNVGFSGDGGAATSATFNKPTCVVTDLLGTRLFIADAYNHRIRMVTLDTGVITAYAGTGAFGFGGDGGVATSAMLANPHGLAVDMAGGLLIADTNNHRIRRVHPVTNVVTTVAGNGMGGFSGDGGAATSASLYEPSAMAVDLAGNLYISDPVHNRVRRVAAATGVIATVAGNGVRGFSGDGGAATSAALSIPLGLAIDNMGDLLIVDALNARVRRVAIASGIISTVIGVGVAGFGGDGGPATSAGLIVPNFIAIDSANNMFVSDRNDHRVRRVIPLAHLSSTASATPSSTPYCAPALFRHLPRTDLVGALVGTALTPGAPAPVASAEACRQACCDAPVCQGFAVATDFLVMMGSTLCYLYVNISQLVPSSTMASGIVESTL